MLGSSSDLKADVHEWTMRGQNYAYFLGAQKQRCEKVAKRSRHTWSVLMQRVPLFRRMLNSNAAHEQSWILKLLIAGMDSDADADICRFDRPFKLGILSNLIQSTDSTRP